LLVLDATHPVDEQDRELLAAIHGRAALVALNKSDLLALHAAAPSEIAGVPVIPTSALTGDGVAELRNRIVELAAGGAAEESGMLTTLRQHQAITTTLAALSDAARANSGRIPHEMILLDLYRALSALDSLTGQTTTDDILNLIFSTFCIGK
jgi:tRNA modification GTPase